MLRGIDYMQLSKGFILTGRILLNTLLMTLAIAKIPLAR